MPTRILIVDDEPHIRTVMRFALESSGYEVAEASSGEEALERVAEGPKWDVILLDERMPGIDGLETLRRLRDTDAEVTIIMVTAFASIELAVEAMKLGATDFLRKPMTPEILRAAVEAALLKSRGEWPSPPAPAAEAPAAGRPYEIGMFNGFRVRHASAGATASEQLFDVIRRDTTSAQRVVVQFAPEVLAAVAEAAGHPVDDVKAFWMQQAGLALARYVWDHAAAPPDGLLFVARPTTSLLEAARHIPAAAS